MKNLIACCGIDCETCDARVATVANDQALREETAKKWSEMFEAPNITAESINCMGCRTDGVKFAQCEVCEIRNCAKAKGFETCGECGELETCQTIGFVLQSVPGAKENLLS